MVIAYAQPMLDATDGSDEQMKRALIIAQTCWNLAVADEADREKILMPMRSLLKMDDAEFTDFYQSVIMPMIERHNEMFPNLLQMKTDSAPQPFPSSKTNHAIAGRNNLCPCNSGKKYKRCCGK